MAKFDHKSNLPKLFKENGLSILPITRGSYVISDFEAYQPLAYDKSIKAVEVNFPDNIESIDKRKIYSTRKAKKLHFLIRTNFVI